MEEKKMEKEMKMTEIENSEKDPQIKKEKTFTIKINSSFVVSVVLVLLIAVSFAQALELKSLKEKISNDEIGVATSSSSTSPSSLKDLPSMVGGC